MGPARGLAWRRACTTHVLVSNLRCFQACSRTLEELGRCHALRVGACPITPRSSSNPDIGFVCDFAGHQLGAGVCGKVRDGSNVRASGPESADSSTSSCLGEHLRRWRSHQRTGETLCPGSSDKTMDANPVFTAIKIHTSNLIAKKHMLAREIPEQLRDFGIAEAADAIGGQRETGCAVPLR